MQKLGALDTKIVHSLPREVPALWLQPSSPNARQALRDLVVL
jgi:hypothetical protein